MKMRKITSLTALISFVLLILTSVILYIVPAGRISYWSDWHLWGLSKTEWGNLHINLGVLFLLAICLHIYYNWNPIILYLKNKVRKVIVFTKDFNVALVIVLIVGFGTYFMVPPFSTVLIFSEKIKDAAADKYGEPPFGHAELAPFNSLVKKTGLDLSDSLDALKSTGVKIDAPDQIFLEIAKKNQMTPKQLFRIIQPDISKKSVSGLPEIPPPGTGNRTITHLCEMYKLDMDSLLKELKSSGLEVDGKETIKALAAMNQLTSIQLYDAVRKSSQRQKK